MVGISRSTISRQGGGARLVDLLDAELATQRGAVNALHAAVIDDQHRLDRRAGVVGRHAHFSCTLSITQRLALELKHVIGLRRQPQSNHPKPGSSTPEEEHARRARANCGLALQPQHRVPTLDVLVHCRPPALRRIV